MTVSSGEIKTRIRSMAATKQITNAMAMVAASKLGKAQNRVSAARPYFQTLLLYLKNFDYYMVLNMKYSYG